MTLFRISCRDCYGELWGSVFPFFLCGGGGLFIGKGVGVGFAILVGLC